MELKPQDLLVLLKVAVYAAANGHASRNVASFLSFEYAGR